MVLAFLPCPALRGQWIPYVPIVSFAARPCCAHQLNGTTLAAPVVIDTPWSSFAPHSPWRCLRSFASFDFAQVLLLFGLRRLYIQAIFQLREVMQEDCAIPVVVCALLRLCILFRRVLELECFPHIRVMLPRRPRAFLSLTSSSCLTLAFSLALLGDQDVLALLQVSRRRQRALLVLPDRSHLQIG